MQRRELSRQFAVNVVFGTGQRLIQLIVGVYVLGYVVRKLGTEEWGLVVLSTSIVTIISFVQLSASAGLGKRLNEFLACGDVSQFRAYFTVGVILSLLLSLVVCLLVVVAITLLWPLFAVPERFATEGQIVVSSIGGSIIFNILALPSIACLQAAHRIDVHAKSQSLSLLFRSAAVVILFEYTTPSASTYAYAVLFTSLLAFLQLWIWVRRNMPEAWAELSGVTRAKVKELVGFNLLNSLGTVNYVLFMQVPAFVMRHDLHLVGLYGIALQMNNIVKGMFFSGYSALLPVMVTLDSTRNEKDLRDLFVASMKCFLASSMMVWFWLVTMGPDVLTMWLGGKVAISDLVVALPWLFFVMSMAIGVMPADATSVTKEKLHVTGSAGIILVSAMAISLFVLIARHPLDPLSSVAVTQAFFFGLSCLVQIIVAIRCFRIEFPNILYDIILRPALPCLLSGGVLLLAPGVSTPRPLTQMALATVAAMIVFALVFWFGTLRSGERAMVLSVMRTQGAAN